MKNFLLVISFCFVIIISANQPYASVNVDFADYVPLHVGNSWTLLDEFNRIYHHQVVGTECLETIATYKYKNSSENQNYDNYTYENKALVVAGFDGTALHPPLILDGQDIDNQYIHFVFSIVPQVATPAGVFNDVVKLTMYDKIRNQEFVSRKQYFAKGVGLVKDENWCASCGGTYTFTALLTSHVAAGPPGADLGTCFPPNADRVLAPIYLLLLK
ncbi:MAG: hypothetical protein U9P36_03905 [Thermodesulfobacteriota bacterium]|nr:hypothetical protein [Thermodesulfobacteriota bacterium]